MPKKPTLTLIGPSSNSIAPPASLGRAGADLWQSIQSEYRVDDAPGRQMLLQICGAADTISECDEIIARDGATIRTKAGLKEHPLLKIQLAARSFIVRALHRLGFDVEPPRSSVGRPPGTFSNYRTR
jgi:hypothetical protein